ncbi:histidine kinase [Flavobacterium akiainvivens]|uniref:Histidine kinase n=1 Tax=Flavobacterium akiainvivens TaxID=1202724 RepID=A0A0M9VI90_9FLAO|nr:response regulator transcription factor [Flavobacterium akiainvivens]KOS06159.1 histidine kinase [Flavobacterium akiainvivens]SFQ68057.1 Response regulator receiver domain-containing protein [Flavobacterium akiainvivens]
MANTIEQINIAFINDKSPIINIISNNLSGINVLFLSENIEDGLSQLSALAELPQVCIINLDFSDSNVLAQLHELKAKYPTLKLIAHSDDDSEQIVTTLLEIGIDGYLLIGTDAEELQTAIEGVCKDKKYFSTGVSKIAREYFSNKADA